MLQGLISFTFPGVAGVRCAFGTRQFGSIAFEPGDGRANVAQRRLALRGLPGADGFAESRQVHGTRIIFEPLAQDPEQEAADEADGMATTQDGLALMIKTADCQPILLAHEGGRHILALHSGWRGSHADFAFAAVGEFCARYALDPAELWAVRGPSLGPAAAEFVNFAQEWGEDFAPWYCERWRAMDLWALTRSQLMRAGLRPERILGLDICTFEGHEMFFSHRHARKYGSEAGRQASLIWIVKK